MPDGAGKDEGCWLYVLAQNLELQVTLVHKPLFYAVSEYMRAKRVHIHSRNYVPQKMRG